MVVIRSQQRNRTAAPICPFCRDHVRLSESLIQCGDCNARHHTECWREIEKCSTCSSTKAMVRKSDLQAKQRRFTSYIFDYSEESHTSLRHPPRFRHHRRPPIVEDTSTPVIVGVTLLITILTTVGYFLVIVFTNDAILDAVRQSTIPIVIILSMVLIVARSSAQQKRKR